MIEKLEKCIRNYKLECKQVLKDNMKDVPIPPDTINIDLSPVKGVIPFIEPLPPSRYYTESFINVHSEDEPILRYKPYISIDKESVEVQFFNGTTIFDSPYNHNSEILKRLVESTSKEEVADFLNIDREYFLTKYSTIEKSRSINNNESSIDIESINNYKTINNNESINNYESINNNESTNIKNESTNNNNESSNNNNESTNNKNESISNNNESTNNKNESIITNNESISNNECSIDDLISQFCAICQLFGCKIHTLYTDTCYDEDTCYCNKLIYPSTGNISFSTGNIDYSTDKINYDSLIIGDRCLSSYNIFIKSGIKIPCKDILCNSRYKRIVKSKYTSQLVKSLIPDLCSHEGPCSKNKKCICFMRGYGCDKKCLCTNCDFLLIGCRCKKKCIAKCRCENINRMCDELCFKKGFTDLRDKNTYTYKSKKNGIGCFAGENIKRGEYIIEYIGELISLEEGNRRANFYDINRKSYIFLLSPDKFIDANSIGNNSRFINHSINANVMPKTVEIGRIKRILLYALCDIKAGEELFYNYQYSEENSGIFGLVD